MSNLSWWVAVGFLGQSLFFMRFLVQWIASERSRKTVMPRAFWYFSLIGGFITLIYAIGNRDLPISLGQAMGLIIYSRNIILSREPQAPAQAS